MMAGYRNMGEGAYREDQEGIARLEENQEHVGHEEIH